MAETMGEKHAMDLKVIVKHLANGSLAENLCLVLQTTEEKLSFCKGDKEFRIVDVLREVCQLQIGDTEPYSVCKECFILACGAYRFYSQAKHSFNIISFYTDQLLSNIMNLNITEEDGKHLLCIPLPGYTPETPQFDYEIDGVGTRNMEDNEQIENGGIIDKLKDDNDIVVVVEDGKTVFYRLQNGELKMIESDDEIDSDSSDDVVVIVNEKTRKKRGPMMYTSCTHCPVKYRFLSKLKDHMKNTHDVDIFYCKICKKIMDSEYEYRQHLSTHIGEYQCTECNMVYRREESLLAHVQSTHKKPSHQMIQNGNICEVCGVILETECALENHRTEKHVKKYTCFYCGRMYKGHAGFEAHIAKHEKLSKKTNGQLQRKQKSKEEKTESCDTSTNDSKRSICKICGKSFVDERSLLWHRRLHDNVRPYVCKECGRGFVSLNRRNQHALCAHSPPARRCPLCPALFHLRSMVNSHLKKVHLNKQQKRRRVPKQQNVYWRTETVPIQDLSVSIQNEVLEMQSSRDQHWISYLQDDLDSKKRKDQSIKQELYTIEMINADMPNDIMGMPMPRDLESIELVKIEKYN